MNVPIWKEFGNTRTKSSRRQEDEGCPNKLGDVEDMGVSYDFNLNLFPNLEPTSFEEVVSWNEWKESM